MSTSQTAEELYIEAEGLLSKGQVHEAARLHKACIEQDNSHLNGAIRFGNYLLFQNNPDAALSVFEQALTKHTNHNILSRGRLFALKDMRQTEAGLSHLSSMGHPPDMALTFGQLLAQKGDIGAANRAFEQAIKTPATAVTAIRNILQTAHLSEGRGGLNAAFEQLKKSYNHINILPLIGADFYREAGDLDKAFACLKDYQNRFPPHPETDQIYASIYIDKGDGELAYKHARQAVTAMPANPVSLMRLSQSALMAGHVEEALFLANKGMQADPQNSFWPAIKASALKSLGHFAEYDALVRVKDTVKSYDLADVAGYESSSEFLTILGQTLRRLHEWKEQPLSQSVRGGTQTSWDLRFEQSPVVRSFFSAVRPFVEEYIRELPDEPSHPFFGRRTEDFYFSGAWSVLLKSQGYHVNHIHPDGWLSSAFYVDIPDSVREGQDKSGWINFGVPPFNMKCSTPDTEICPVKGRLVLFPSFLWHGTHRFSGEQSRLTLPFDVRPQFS